MRGLMSFGLPRPNGDQAVGGLGQSGTGGENAGVGGQSSAAQGGSANGGQGGSTTAGSDAGVNVEVLRSQLSAVTVPDITDSEYAAFISDSNTFGLELYQQLNVDQSLTTKNGVFSPTSAQLALAMTYGAAVGDTATAMKATLHDNLGAAKYHVGSNRLQRDLASRNYSQADSYGYTRRIELAPANSLWTDRTLSIKTTYLVLSPQTPANERVVSLNRANVRLCASR